MRCATVILLALLSGTPALAEVLRAGWVPNRLIPQGQVQLHGTGSVSSIQVVLHTRFLDRVVKAIAEKESANWPAEHPDARSYIDHLHAARAELKRDTGGDGKEAMVIDFQLEADRPVVAWSTGKVEEDAHGHLVLREAKPLIRWEPSPEYLARNAELILEDTFGISRAQAQAWLRGRFDD